MSGDKSNEKSTEKSAVGLLDKKALFSKLVRVQYPMAQDAPSPEVEEEDYSKMGYRQQMDALIKKYEDEL